MARGAAKSSFRKSKKTRKRPNSNTRQISSQANLRFASAEVIDIVLEDTHKDYNPQARIFIGAIKARQLEHEFGVPDENLSFYRPYFGVGIWTPPLIGEVVTLVAAAGKSAQRDHKVTELYYLPPINIWQDVNNNQLPGSSYRRVSSETTEAEECNPSGQYTSNPGTVRSGLPDVPLGKIFDAKNIQKLFPYEGDVMLEGRSGHSIRFGSTVKGAEYPNWWSTTGENGDPITIISDGHSPTPGEFEIDDTTYDNIYKIEDPNKDGSVVILTCTQTIPIEVPSVIGNNIRQDSYGNVSKIPKIGPTELNFKAEIDKAEVENKESSGGDDRDQEKQVEDNKKEEDIKEEEKEEKEESNVDEEITDIIIGGYLAYQLAGGVDSYTGWSVDIPQGTYGKYKSRALVKEVYQACVDYPGDLEGKNVILDTSISSLGWDSVKDCLGARIIHINKYFDKKDRLTSVLPIYLKYDGSFRFGGYYNRTMDARQFEEMMRTNRITIDDTKPQWPRQMQGRPELNKDRVLDKSEWNVTQTYNDLKFSYFNRLMRGPLGGRPYKLDGSDNTIVAMMKVLKERGAASIKLLGVGDYFDNTPGYASLNQYLQEQADQVDIATFVGGYEMSNQQICGGIPKDLEAYRAQINGQGEPPAPPPPPSQKGQRVLETYKGFNIMLYTEEKGNSYVWFDRNQTENPPFSTEIKTAAEINIDPMDEIDKGYWFELEIQTYEVTGRNGYMFRTIDNAVELFKEDLDIAIEDWEDPIL